MPALSQAKGFSSVYGATQVIAGRPYSPQGAKTDYCLRRSPNGSVYRFEVHQGDRSPSDDYKERSELGGSASRVPYGTVFYGSYSFKVAAVSADFPVMDDIFCNLGQMHNVVASPCLTFLMVSDTEIQVRRRYGLSSAAQQAHEIDMPFQRGVWNNVVFEGMCHPTSGYLKVWWNGVLIVNRSNVPFGYTDQVETYWKFGIYRSTSNPIPMAAEFANMYFGFADQSARVATPLPIVYGTFELPVQPIVDFLQTYKLTGSALSYTFASVDLGEEADDRHIAITLNYEAAAAQDITALTIGGVAAVIHRKSSSGASSPRSVIASAKVPAGVAADVVAAFDGNVTDVGIAVYRLVSITNNIPVITAGTTGVPANMTVKRGACIAVSYISGGVSGANSCVIAGVDKKFDLTFKNNRFHAGGCKSIASDNVALTMTFQAGSGQRSVAAVWQ